MKRKWKSKRFFLNALIFPAIAAGVAFLSPALAVSAGYGSRLSDSHQGVAAYAGRKCESCHAPQTRGIHTVRAGLSCRQCHGGEPIAAVDHYYSPMNSIRRHAYVCAKCHTGASASFATYVIHPPNPAGENARRDFPSLFYAFWIMMGIAALTFLVFLPHTLLWGIRELFTGKKRAGGKEEDHEK
jgi:hypothetical protein